MPSLHEIDAVVLVGGQGTRLRSVVSDRPKPLVEVAGRPFLSYVLDTLAHAGIRRVTLCTGYRGGMVEATFGHRHGPLRLAYSRETEPLGTAGAVVAALPKLTSSTILVTHGDSLCDADLPAFLRFHRWQGCDASLLLTRAEDASRFGRVEIDETERIVVFTEKDAAAVPGWINAGVYLVERRVLLACAAVPLLWERDVFPALMQGKNEESAASTPPRPLGAQGPAESRLCGWPGGGAFLDIGTPESLAQAEGFLRQTAFSSASPVSCAS